MPLLFDIQGFEKPQSGILENRPGRVTSLHGKREM